MSRMFIQTVAAAGNRGCQTRRRSWRGGRRDPVGRGDRRDLPAARVREGSLAGRRPRPVAYYNTQYFTPGNSAAKASATP
jgi:hypothetical protein